MKRKVITILSLIVILTGLLVSPAVAATQATPVKGTVSVTNNEWTIIDYNDMGVIGQAQNSVEFEGDLEGTAVETLNFKLSFDCDSPGCTSRGVQSYVGSVLDSEPGVFQASISRHGWDDPDELREFCQQVLQTGAFGLDGFEGYLSYSLICSGASPWVGTYSGAFGESLIPPIYMYQY